MPGTLTGIQLGKGGGMLKYAQFRILAICILAKPWNFLRAVCLGENAVATLYSVTQAYMHT